MSTEPIIVGVRHHSPACARLVRHVIHREKPDVVLIEGPCDMNERIGELTLKHTLPIAIYSYRAPDPAAGNQNNPEADTRTWSSWCPLCDYSPEWVAVTEAQKIGAKVLFNDLPAWHKAFEGIENRYSDRHQRASDRISEVCERVGFEDMDALWDHLFEQPQPEEDLEARLRDYFLALRADEAASARDAPREELMATYVAWAMAKGHKTMVVCGGYHAPALARAWRSAPREIPPVPAPAPGIRIGSYLVPYSFYRLDAFTGYQSGMPSPLFYQRVWEIGAEEAARAMMFDAISHLRKKSQLVSPADSIAVSTLAHGLKMVRGHAALARIDVLDGLAGALVKDALDVPLPWTRRGTLLARTEPLLVEIVAAFSGDRHGQLAAETPRPPLVADAFAELERAGIELERQPSRFKPALDDARGLAQSRVLHRLRVLGIAGFKLERAMKLRRGETDLREQWTVHRALDADATLVEAAMWGATLEAATMGKLEHLAERAANMAALADVLGDAVLCGARDLTGRLLGDIERVIGQEPSLGVLGAALARLLGLWHHDTILGVGQSKDLGRVISLAFERGMWLLEGIQGATAAYDKALVAAVVALRDSVRHGRDELGISPEGAARVVTRKMQDPDAPASIRGASLGFAWSITPDLEDAPAEVPAERAVRSVRGTPHDRLGDFLAGLFALAREEVRSSPMVVGAIDEALSGMDRHEFMVAVPALRVAFNYFPPREKEQIAKTVIGIHGKAESLDPRELTKPAISPEITHAGLALDAEVEARAKRFGLG